MDPYTRMSYYADIINKTPSGQMNTTVSTQPTPSPFSQIAGLGIAGLGAYNAYNKTASWGLIWTCLLILYSNGICFVLVVMLLRKRGLLQ
jgi:hypothetical protein